MSAPGSGWRDHLAKYQTPEMRALVDELFAEDDRPYEHVCKHCGAPIVPSDVFPWKHLEGGYSLCIIGDSRPGTHAEP
jgi:hypothetical protein